jgi:hypothetical protein
MAGELLQNLSSALSCCLWNQQAGIGLTGDRRFSLDSEYIEYIVKVAENRKKINES